MKSIGCAHQVPERCQGYKRRKIIVLQTAASLKEVQRNSFCRQSRTPFFWDRKRILPIQEGLTSQVYFIHQTTFQTKETRRTKISLVFPPEENHLVIEMHVNVLFGVRTPRNTTRCNQEVFE